MPSMHRLGSGACANGAPSVPEALYAKGMKRKEQWEKIAGVVSQNWAGRRTGDTVEMGQETTFEGSSRDRDWGGLGFTTEAISSRAVEAERRHDHVEAARHYRILTDIDPSDERAALKLAHNLVEAGRYRQATDEYLRVSAIFAKQGRARKALTVAHRAMRLHPGRATRRRIEPIVRHLGGKAQALCEEIARAHLLAGRDDLVTDIHRLMVEHDPDSIPKRMKLAELALSQGRGEEALAELEIVAEGLLGHGRTGDFVRVSEMMLAHGGGTPWVMRELARFYARTGQLDRAMPRLQALLRLVPEDLWGMETLVRARAQLGEPELASELLVKLVKTMADGCDRADLRDLLERAEAWSSDDDFLFTVEMLRVRCLVERRRPTGIVPRRRGSVSPPPPPPAGKLTLGGDALDLPIELDIEIEPDELGPMDLVLIDVGPPEIESGVHA